jgi:hypothetical protein
MASYPGFDSMIKGMDPSAGIGARPGSSGIRPGGIMGKRPQPRNSGGVQRSPKKPRPANTTGAPPQGAVPPMGATPPRLPMPPANNMGGNMGGPLTPPAPPVGGENITAPGMGLQMNQQPLPWDMLMKAYQANIGPGLGGYTGWGG